MLRSCASCVGSEPLKRLARKCRVVSDVHSPSSEGTVPDMRVYVMDRPVVPPHPAAKSLGGSVPEISSPAPMPVKLRSCVRLFRRASEEGSVPLNEVPWTSSHAWMGARPISVGMVPLRLASPMREPNSMQRPPQGRSPASQVAAQRHGRSEQIVEPSCGPSCGLDGVEFVGAGVHGLSLWIPSEVEQLAPLAGKGRNSGYGHQNPAL